LSKENGYEVERMVAHRMGPYGSWYEVNDPEQIRSRVELISFSPIQLLVQARRKRIVPIFEKTPQQSDFVPRWDDSSSTTDGKPATPPPPGQPPFGAPRPGLAKTLPGLARLINVFKIGFGLLHSHSLSNRKSFRRVRRMD
jgi:hypothetical protein